MFDAVIANKFEQREISCKVHTANQNDIDVIKNNLNFR